MKNHYIVYIVIILQMISSIIGAMIPYLFHLSENRKRELYQLISGLMIGISCFELIPESLQIGNLLSTLWGMIVGIGIVVLIEVLTSKVCFFNSKLRNVIIIVLSMGIHNLVEGLAIGSSLEYSFSLGISILIVMFLHDIPECIVVGASEIEGNSLKKVVINGMIVGAFTVSGIILGIFIGSLSDFATSFSLGLSAGAMLYMTSVVLIPLSYQKKKSFLKNTSYFLLGVFLSIIASSL